MWEYRAPLRDMQFVIEDVLDAPRAWGELPAFDGLDADTAREILTQAGRFAAEVLAPINGPADLEGCTWQDGTVRTPAGFRQAYRAYVEAGWPSLAGDPVHGGQGLPLLLDAALIEMTSASNHAWTMYPGLLHGACACLQAHGSEELKARYLDKLVSGEWLATMNLTEPQAGSDLAQVRTRAEPAGDGRWAVRGSKIFISGGEHDLTDNIVHLVLARLPDAPAGSRGLSLLLVPRVLPDGSRNAVHCDGIEKKMGIKGSATCAMRFDGATGWLVGEPHRGLAAMFVMMNAARLHVGLQGLGHLEMACQNAHAYAQERMQGRGMAIAAHPAMRRILWRLRALTDGARVIAYWTAMLIDESHHHPEAGRRAQADMFVGLLTPVVKGFLTEQGHRGADDALQVWGGYGYVHDYGIEQTVRDSRIAMIYEGTNEIQAIDLLQRKVLGDGGTGFAQLLDLLAADAETGRAHTALRPHADALDAQIASARAAVTDLLATGADDAERPLRVADDFLAATGHLLLAWAWLRIARAATVAGGTEPQAEQRLHAARFGLEWLLPASRAQWARVVQRELGLPEAPGFE